MANVHRPSAPQRRGGFTLVELLVVIGIITILIAVLVPVINKARQAAYVTSTQSFISGIVSACERYNQDFRSYPGPLGPDQVARGGNTAAPPVNIRPTELAPPGDTILGSNPEEQITGAENLVLGLLGGLAVDPGNGQLFYNADTVGSGPMKLGPISSNQVVNPKRYTPYVEKKGLSDGLYKYDSNLRAGDTNIPEFVDSFPEPMPLLYMRAKKGSVGVAGRMQSGSLNGRQYRINDVLAYTDVHAQATSETLSIGATINSGGVTKLHGLRHLGVYPDGTTQDPTDASDSKNATGAMDAIAYLTAKSSVNAVGLDSTWGTADDIITPVSKDAFVLISAGKDRIYGTKDDITNFGEVGQ